METDWYALGRRAVACKHWQWMPGMLVMSDPLKVPRAYGLPAFASELRARLTSICLGRWHGVGHYHVDAPDWEHESVSGDDLPGTMPDFSEDAATIGCLLSLVRSAYESVRGEDCIVSTVHTKTGWGVGARFGSEGFAAICLPTFATEAEALIAALEAAP